jgi:hypothetical protein
MLNVASLLLVAPKTEVEAGEKEEQIDEFGLSAEDYELSDDEEVTRSLIKGCHCFQSGPFHVQCTSTISYQVNFKRR